MVNLSIENLVTGYSKEMVLNGVSLNADDGDFIGIIGPNGSGKSTLVRAITGILEVWEGNVKLDSDPVSSLDRKEIAKKVAVVPQNTHISFPFSVWEIVLMGRTSYLGRFENPGNEDKKIAERSMEITGTTRFKERSIKNLSGGELQRVIVARALTQNPELLVLDEATSHLDIGHKKEIMDTVKRKNRNEGLAVISIHHNLNLAARYCERILLLDEGEEHAFGPPKEVLTNSNLRTVYGIEAEIHQHPKDGTLYVSPIERQTHSKENGLVVHVICGGNSAGSLLNVLVEKGYEVSAGVLNVMDSDFEKADFLDLKTVTEAPFSSISQESYRKNVQLIERADIVIVTDFPVGEGNLLNIKAVKDAVKDDKEFIVIDPESIEDRDYTENKKASKLYDSILEKKKPKSVKSTEKVQELL